MGRLVMASTPRAYRHLHAPAPSGVYADKRCIVPATKAAECTDGRACPRPWRSLRAFRRMPTRQGIRRSIWFTSGERELIVRPSHRRAHRYLPSRCACASRRVVQRRRRTGVNAKRSSSPGKVRHRRHYALQSVIGRQRVNASGSEKLTIRPFTGFAYVRHSSSLRAIRNSHSSWSTSFRPWQCLA
jgi:hypothetical protein